LGLEQEVKLAYPDVEAARQAVTTAGGRLAVSRRLLDDRFFDTHDFRLRRDAQALRIRQDGERATLTWKGPPHPGPIKTREEIEADCRNAMDLVALLGALGYVPCFRSQKYREEYAVGGALVTVDETPFAVFVEVEATPAIIGDVVLRLGRTPADYEVASYVALWRRWCTAHDVPFGDMVFDHAAAVPRP
jgi:adenylate cyclase, class 2